MSSRDNYQLEFFLNNPNKSNDIRRGKATEEELGRYIETSRDIYDLPLYIDETLQ